MTLQLRAEGPFDYIRRTYGVPAQRGMRVNMDGKDGTITRSEGPHLLVRFDGSSHAAPVHPTWRMRYYDKQNNLIWSDDDPSTGLG